MLEAIFWIAEEVVGAGSKCQQSIRRLVKTPGNIGKMLTIDVETGEYKIGINSSEGEIGLKQSSRWQGYLLSESATMLA